MRVSCGSFLAFLILVLGSGKVAFAQDTNFPAGPQYLMNFGSPLFLRPISTPSISLQGPPLEMGADNSTGVLIAGAQNHTDLPPTAVTLPQIDLFPIFYGDIPVSDIEISFRGQADGLPRAKALPESILDTGVAQVTTAQALRERGFGATLAEAATYDKAHASHATRVYTNADIDRLHGGS